MFVGLQISAELEEVAELIPQEDVQWYVKIDCTNCGNVDEKKHCLSEDEMTEFGQPPAQVHFGMKCKFCTRPGTLTIVKRKSYLEDDSGKFKTVVIFECRGIKPVSFELGDGWTVKTITSGKEFNDISLSTNEWMDYDTNSNLPVSISEVKTNIVHEKTPH